MLILIMLFFIIIIIFIIISVVVFLIIKNKNKKNNNSDYYSRSRIINESLGQKIRKVFTGKTIDEKNILELEDILLKADLGTKTVIELIDKLKKQNIKNIDDAISFLKAEMLEYLSDKKIILEKGILNIFLILGVNGVGKTTSIAKAGNYYLKQGLKVLLAAGDTFRAAAIEQLTKWANRLDIPIIKQNPNSDPSGVVYDAVDSAKAKNVDVLLIDTAGRLHNKANLMNELKKIEGVISKKGGNVKKNILVLDSTTGQNALQQAVSFNEAIGIDGIILAKYDSQAKAGIILNIQKNLNIPIYFIGTGEKIDDLQEFDKNKFIENIFN